MPPVGNVPNAERIREDGTSAFIAMWGQAVLDACSDDGKPAIVADGMPLQACDTLHTFQGALVGHTVVVDLQRCAARTFYPDAGVVVDVGGTAGVDHVALLPVNPLGLVVDQRELRHQDLLHEMIALKKTHAQEEGRDMGPMKLAGAVDHACQPLGMLGLHERLPVQDARGPLKRLGAIAEPVYFACASDAWPLHSTQPGRGSPR